MPATPPAASALPLGAGDVAGGPVAACAGVAPAASWLDIDGRYPQVQDSWARPLHLPRNHQVAVSPDGQWAFAHTTDGRVSAFDPATGVYPRITDVHRVMGQGNTHPDGTTISRMGREQANAQGTYVAVITQENAPPAIYVGSKRSGFTNLPRSAWQPASLTVTGSSSS